MEFRQQRSKWLHWLEEPVYWRNSVTDGNKRCIVVHALCQQSLIPLVEKYGYTWAVSSHELTNSLLNLLYRMFQREKISFHDTQWGYDPEHFTEYTDRMDTDVWDHFWEYWGNYADFDEFGFAYDLRFTIYLFVWNHLNLSLSRAVIEKEQYDSDDNENPQPKGKDDPYLQDMVLGIQDKHKHM